jgi:23S rRNA pseudoU1915 N3-methylase RlmH
MEAVMSEVMTIKQMSADLKRYWAEEAKRHDRSMNKEVLRVLEEERARREAAKSPAKDMDSIMAAARRLQSFAVVDQRPIEEILYDEEGMPK